MTEALGKQSQRDVYVGMGIDETQAPSTLRLMRKATVLLTTLVLADSILASVSFALFVVASIPHIFIGLVLVGLGELVLRRSTALFATFDNIFYLFWLFHRATWVGSAVLSVGIGLVVGSGFILCQAFRPQASHANKARTGMSSVLAPLGMTKAVAQSLVATCVLGTVVMPLGILVIRWHGSGNDAVTDNMIRSTIVAFLGTFVQTSSVLYRQNKKAELELRGEDGLSLFRTKGASS